MADAGGIARGEAEVLAAAVSRNEPALLFERQAVRLGQSLGLDVWSPVRLLFAGTADPAQLTQRMRRLAALVQMRFEDVQKLIQLIEEPRQ